MRGQKSDEPHANVAQLKIVRELELELGNLDGFASMEADNMR